MKKVFVGYDKELEKVISVRETEYGARADIENYLRESYSFEEWHDFAVEEGFISIAEFEETLLKNDSLYDRFDVVLYKDVDFAY